jgi:hypothetical protein
MLERFGGCSFYFGLVAPVAVASKVCSFLTLLALFFVARSAPNELRRGPFLQRLKLHFGLLPPDAARLPGASSFQVRMRWLVFTQAFVIAVNVALLLALRVCL